MRKLLSAIAVVCALSGCGYHPVTNVGALSEGNGVNVLIFANTTYRGGMEGVLGRAMVDELARRTGGRVVSAEQASTVLSGTILSYDSGAVSYSASDTIREYRSALRVEAVLRDAKTQKVLWKEQLTETQVYPVNPNIALQQNAEDAALERICRKLSEDVWHRLSERF
ncbi:LPS assembly lipoprotein LptE [Geomonas sp. RF6]|uniref:LPS assembly lipoprotein LptE n=1 Tax=Geomonas sp. RF6 TaxID=2897342 RepID=UPI001E5EB3B2|nr:LPS assembly lipoprotein LptE [Geomonas sp. RF6]UFS68981.1 LPS assembly lipoprotein LptE [Geomonas sp. RF6]